MIKTTDVTTVTKLELTPKKGTTAGGTDISVERGSGGFTSNSRIILRSASGALISTEWIDCGSDCNFKVGGKTKAAPAGVYRIWVDINGDGSLTGDLDTLTNFTYTDFAYVSNLASDSISVIDTGETKAANAKFADIADVGDTPIDLAVAKDSGNTGKLAFSLVDTATAPKVKAYETGNFTLAGTFELPLIEEASLRPLTIKADERKPWLFVASPTRGPECVPLPGPGKPDYCPPYVGNIIGIDASDPAAMRLKTGLENIMVHNGVDADGDGLVDGTEVPRRVAYPIDIAAPIVKITPSVGDKVATDYADPDGKYPSRFAYATTAAEVVERRELRCYPSPLDPQGGGFGDGCEMFVYYTQGPNRVSIIDLNEWVYNGTGFEPNPTFGKEVKVLGQIDSFLPPTDIPEELGLTMAKTDGEYVYVISRKYADKMFKIDALTQSFVLDAIGSPVEILLGPAPTDVAYGRYKTDVPFPVDNKYLYVAQGGDPVYAETGSSVKIIDATTDDCPLLFPPPCERDLVCADPPTCTPSKSGKYPTSIAAMAERSQRTGWLNVYTANFNTNNVSWIRTDLDPPALNPGEEAIAVGQGPKRIDIQPIYRSTGWFTSAWQLIADAPMVDFMSSPSKKEELLNQFKSVFVLLDGNANVRAVVARTDNIISKADRWISNPQLRARFVELMTAGRAAILVERQ